MSNPFLWRAQGALSDPDLQRLLDRNADLRQRSRRAAWAELEGIDELRARAADVRRQVVSDLDRQLTRFVERLQENGIRVHRAADADQASRTVVEIAQQHKADLIAKSKSMVTEEIGLNAALEAAGLHPVETDLGEFIVQLRDEHPSHLVAPALHLSVQQVAQTFRSRLKAETTDDIQQLNQVARDALRQVFYRAQVGLSGVNFGVAETGTLCLVTNEGNGRMVSTLPRVHVAVMGIERLLPSLPDLALMLRLLARSATGQKMTSYVTLFHGPRQAAEPDGPVERHLVLVDNGRSALAAGPLAEALHCIRCGSCLNACPVYREAGGHAYDSVYSGPIGSVVSPGLFGVAEFGHLAHASTLCSACVEACPVGIDIPSMLLKVRQASDLPSSQLRSGLKWYSWLARSPKRYRWAQRLAALATRMLPRRAGWITSLPGPLAAWTKQRDFPPFAARPLRSRLRSKIHTVTSREPEIEPLVSEGQTAPVPPAEEERPARFEAELTAVGGEFIRCSEAELPDRVVGQLYILGASRILAWGPVEPVLYMLNQRLEDDGFEPVVAELPLGGDRAETLEHLDRAQVGITGAVAAFADTGTVVLSTSSRRSLIPSLLPEAHFVILRRRDLYESFEDWLDAGGGGYISNSSNLVMITGPSRTADIEMTLTVGVHGPKQLTAFLVE